MNEIHHHSDGSAKFCRSPATWRRFANSSLAFAGAIADMEAGRLVVDEPLANRVRSGRKQP
jgi:hypothetical protein